MCKIYAILIYITSWYLVHTEIQAHGGPEKLYFNYIFILNREKEYRFHM